MQSSYLTNLAAVCNKIIATKFFLSCLAFSLAAGSLHMILLTPLMGDDILNSFTKGVLLYYDPLVYKLSAPNFIDLFSIKLNVHGRLGEWGNFITSNTFYHITSVTGIKLVQYSLVILNIVLLSWFVQRLFRWRVFPFILICLIGLLYQIKFDSYDSLIVNPTVYTSLLTLLLLSFISFAQLLLNKPTKYQRYTGAVYYTISLLCFFFTLSSEISYFLFPIFIALALIYKRSFIKSIILAMPHTLLALYHMGIITYYKVYAVSDGYDGTQISWNLLDFLQTFFYQLAASLPLVYHFAKPLPFNISIVAIIYGCLLSLCVWLALKHLTTTRCKLSRKHLCLACCIGLLLLTIPAFLISLSIKYQHDIIALGFGYSSHVIYIQWQGMFLLVLSGVIYLTQKYQFLHKSYIYGCFAVLLGVIATLNFAGNQNSVTQINKVSKFHHENRELFTQALYKGILDELPQDAMVMVNYPIINVGPPQWSMLKIYLSTYSDKRYQTHISVEKYLTEKYGKKTSYLTNFFVIDIKRHTGDVALVARITKVNLIKNCTQPSYHGCYQLLADKVTVYDGKQIRHFSYPNLLQLNNGTIWNKEIAYRLYDLKYNNIDFTQAIPQGVEVQGSSLPQEHGISALQEAMQVSFIAKPHAYTKVSIIASGFLTAQHPSTTIAVYLNDSKIGVMDFHLDANQPKEFIFSLPAQLLETTRYNTFTFKRLNFKQQLGADPRISGINLRKLSLQ